MFRVVVDERILSSSRPVSITLTDKAHENRAELTVTGFSATALLTLTANERAKKPKTINSQDSQMVTHFSTN